MLTRQRHRPLPECVVVRQWRQHAGRRCGCGGTGRRSTPAMCGARARGSSSLPTRTLALDSASGRAHTESTLPVCCVAGVSPRSRGRKPELAAPVCFRPRAYLTAPCVTGVPAVSPPAHYLGAMPYNSSDASPPPGGGPPSTPGRPPRGSGGTGVHLADELEVYFNEHAHGRPVGFVASPKWKQPTDVYENGFLEVRLRKLPHPLSWPHTVKVT